jgi:biopolymer transport protein ExbD
MNKPQINVTPLIDVLLVLLIIFMVVSPLKPSAFKARIPSEPSTIQLGKTHPDTLVISVGRDSSLKLNNEATGNVGDTDAVISLLKKVFDERIANGNVSQSFADDPQRPAADRIERTVFIQAPRTLDYGSVARVIDAAKLAGAYPISLQIDDLD